VPNREPDLTTFSKAELAQVKRIADRDGVTIEQAATRLGQQWLQEKVKRRTGKGPAKVYPLKRKP
jgi:hypothetical protein